MKRHSVRSEDLQAVLDHVRFIGGGSGGGKSTVASRLAAKHDLRLYHTEPLSKYADRTTPVDAPFSMHSWPWIWTRGG